VVDLAIRVVELQHRGVDRAVLLTVEVLGPQLLLNDERVEVAFVEQDRTENRLLGGQMMWWYRCGRGDAHLLIRV
jgi:hypothetical protein